MSSVGSYLRDLRTQRGVSLEEISRATRVLTQYLEALESDAFEALPAPVFTKGFIRAYCQALGILPHDAVALYEGRDRTVVDVIKPTTAAPRPVTRAAPTQTSKRRQETEKGSRGAVLAGFVMLVILGVALFGVTLWLQPARETPLEGRAAATASDPKPEPVPPPAAIAVAPAPSPSIEAPRPVAAAEVPVPVAAQPTATGPVTPPLISGVTAPYRLVARTSEKTWIRVRTDDGRTSEENIPAGETREWVSNRPFVLSIGNAGGVAFELNGRRVAALGPSGTVIPRLVLPPETQ